MGPLSKVYETRRWLKAHPKALAKLSERQRMVLELRFGLRGDNEVRTFEDLAQEMGITKERVRQIQLRALEKLMGEIQAS